MADKKITQLTNITGADLVDADEFVVVDISADETKAITLGELKEAFDSGSGFVRITGDTMTGDLTVPNVITSGNVDGRDISADGTKLDGIEAGATADQTAAEIKTAYESNADTNEFSDAEQTKLAGIEANADVTDTANVTAAGALMDSELTDITAVKALDQGVATTDKPTFNGINSTEALPTVRPSLLLDFANSKTLDPRITFTRGSTATYWDGKTTTKAEENLLPQSQTIGVSPWLLQDATVASNTTTAPDGTTTADTLAVDGDLNQPQYARLDDVLTEGNTTYTLSAYMKKNTSDYGALTYRPTGSNVVVVVWNLSTGAKHTSGTTGSTTLDSDSITDVGNGWYRCVMTVSNTLATSSVANGRYGIFPTPDGTFNDQGYYFGDDAGSIYVWGMQAEQRSSATSYTATTSSPIVKYQPTLQTAASGEARFDHDPVTGESKGLLIEEARTNLEDYSEFINGWGANGISFYRPYAISPDGTRSAAMMEINSQETVQGAYPSTSYSVTLGTYYTASVFVRKETNSNLAVDFTFYFRNSIGGGSIYGSLAMNSETGFDSFSQSSATTATYIVEDLGSWWRISVTSNEIPTGSIRANIRMNNQAVGKRLVVWGFQVEVGAFPTSYIPTAGSTVTRSGEACYSLDSAFTPSGTFTALAKASLPYDNTVTNINASMFSFGPDRIQLRYDDGTGAQFLVYNPSAVVDLYAGTPSVNSGMTAVQIGQNDFKFSSAGSTVQTDSGGIFDVPETMYIGNLSNSSEYLNGHIQKIAFYTASLPNATLQAMTEE